MSATAALHEFDLDPSDEVGSSSSGCFAARYVKSSQIPQPATSKVILEFDPHVFIPTSPRRIAGVRWVSQRSDGAAHFPTTRRFAVDFDESLRIETPATLGNYRATRSSDSHEEPLRGVVALRFPERPLFEFKLEFATRDLPRWSPVVDLEQPESERGE